MPCPVCDTGCDNCKGRGRRAGRISVSGKVSDLVGPSEREAITAWNLFQKGILPDDGGFLDQSAWFCQSVLFLESLSGKDALKAKSESEQRQREMKAKLPQTPSAASIPRGRR